MIESYVDLRKGIDGTGFCLLHIILEKGRFKWNASEDKNVAILDRQQFSWLFERLKTTQKTAFNKSSPNLCEVVIKRLFLKWFQCQGQF